MGLRVQYLKIPPAAFVDQPVPAQAQKNFVRRLAAKIADTVQTGETITAKVDKQVFDREQA